MFKLTLVVLIQCISLRSTSFSGSEVVYTYSINVPCSKGDVEDNASLDTVKTHRQVVDEEAFEGEKVLCRATMPYNRGSLIWTYVILVCRAGIRRGPLGVFSSASRREGERHLGPG